MKSKLKDQDSDSGEDFDYGEEEEEGCAQQDQNLEFLDYISNMDLGNI